MNNDVQTNMANTNNDMIKISLVIKIFFEVG